MERRWRVFAGAMVAALCVILISLLVFASRPSSSATVLAVSTPPLFTLRSSSTAYRRPSPTPPAKPLVVYVTGAVVHPGVYRLAPGARVNDAVAAAGGAADYADLERINLAALVTDGEQVTVPALGETLPSPTAGRGTRRAVHAPTPAPAFPIDVNTATEQQLRTLPGVGKITAARIVAYRADHGPFTSLDQLIQAGVRKAELNRIRSLLTLQ